MAPWKCKFCDYTTLEGPVFPDETLGQCSKCGKPQALIRFDPEEDPDVEELKEIIEFHDKPEPERDYDVIIGEKDDFPPECINVKDLLEKPSNLELVDLIVYEYIYGCETCKTIIKDELKKRFTNIEKELRILNNFKEDIFQAVNNKEDLENNQIIIEAFEKIVKICYQFNFSTKENPRYQLNGE